MFTELSNGVKMPMIGLGTWQSNGDDVKKSVKLALKEGYRLIDTATLYQNEADIGEALKEAFNEGIVKREDVFVTTKAFTHQVAPDVIEDAIKCSLKLLQLDYVDLYLAHLPTATNNDMSFRNEIAVEDIWKGLENLYRLGYAKAIGVSNFTNDQIRRVLKVQTVPIHAFQVELHLYYPQKEHRELCSLNNIKITSYGSLGSPGRLNFEVEGKKPFESGANAKNELTDVNVQELAKKYNKSPAQILLRHLIQRGISVIPKSVNPTRIAENIKVFDFELTDCEMNQLESHNIPDSRLFTFEQIRGHKEDPYK